MVTVSQIREHLVDMLVSLEPEKALDAFEKWLANASWNMHLDSKAGAIQMVGKLQLTLAELDNCSIDNETARNIFREIAVSFDMDESNDTGVVIKTGSSSVIAQVINQEGLSVIFGKQREEGLSYTPSPQSQQ
jgi:predicted HAD superfamily phosphohydrolase